LNQHRRVIYVGYFKPFENARLNRVWQWIINILRPSFGIPKAGPKKSDHITEALIRAVAVAESSATEVIAYLHLPNLLTGTACASNQNEHNDKGVKRA
jgi:hypothetical protein